MNCGFFSVIAMQNMIFKKKIPTQESDNIIFILPTERPCFLAVLPVGKKN